MILEGTYTMTAIGSLQAANDFIACYCSYGWRVKKISKVRHWPYFWKVTYTVVIQKDIIVDQKHIIETPLTDLK
jgi:hypothetical protein